MLPHRQLLSLSVVSAGGLCRGKGRGKSGEAERGGGETEKRTQVGRRSRSGFASSFYACLLRSWLSPRVLSSLPDIL